MKKMNRWGLAIRNLRGKPGRAAALILLVAFQALAMLGGSLVIGSLQSGLSSLENRMGADIIVVPSSARSKLDPESLFLQGTIGTYYMSRDKLEKIEADYRLADGAHAAAGPLPLSLRRVHPEG